MLYTKKIEIPIYNQELCLAFSPKPEAEHFIKKYPELTNVFHNDDIIYGCAIKGYKKDRKRFYILLAESPIDKITPGIISHECFHMSSLILRDTGYIQDYQNEEPQAYLLQHITEEVFKFLRKIDESIISYKK